MARQLPSSWFYLRSLVALSMAVMLSAAAEPEVNSNDCDTCRTIVEQFYKGWEKVISGLAADGTYESRPGGAPKITYNQDIEDYLQGFCASEYMKGFAPFVGEGCVRIMKQHHRPIVGKFLHGEERYGSALVRTERPQRINGICKDLVSACPGPLSSSALAKRKLDLLELFDSLCTDVYQRHDDFPETHNAVCSDMWEEDEDAFMEGLIRTWGGEEGAAGSILLIVLRPRYAGPSTDRDHAAAHVLCGVWD